MKESPGHNRVAEVDARRLMQERQRADPPLLLDCREPYEWRQLRIPGEVIYIPMNEIPARMDDLDREAEIVVVCAHGIRSYMVAAYLLQQGFSARSLRGGVAEWQAQNGEIETG